jgi:outer membrane phospholipase A
VAGLALVAGAAFAEEATGFLQKRQEPPDIAAERFQGEFYAYEPIYALVGGGDDYDIKFQFSFKLRIANPIYFGFTQTSVWDLSESSAPFHDSSYRPSVFYYDPYRIYRNAGGSLGLMAGVEHESNGKSGPDSRSINILFARPLWLIGDEREYHWRISPRLYAYLEKEDNDDIQDYRGYGDFHVAYRHPKKAEVAVTARKGSGDHYSLLAEYSLPFSEMGGVPLVGRWLKLFPAMFYAQLYNGWGETMLDYYRKEDTQFRIGISATRDSWAEPVFCPSTQDQERWERAMKECRP